MFSPSQTKLFARCRFKWFLSKHLGTDYASVGKRDLAACIGISIGAALQSYYLSKRTLTEVQLIEQAKERYKHEVVERCGKIRAVEDCEEAVKYPDMIPGMVKAFLKKHPIPDDWEITNAEAPVSDDYAAYLDLAGKSDRGPWVADIKCKMNEKGGHITNSILKFQFDSQLLQYVREWSKQIGQRVEFYRIIYIVGSPIPTCIFQDFEVDWEYMDLREMSDAVIWSDMLQANAGLKHLSQEYGGYSNIPLDKVMSHAPMAPEHMDGIFKCDMWDACLLYGGNAKLSPAYIQIERKS